MAVALSSMGLGPLVSEVSRLGIQAIQPGRLGADPAAEVLMRADTVAQLLDGVRDLGGFPLDRAVVSREQAMTRTDEGWAPVIVWNATIVYAA